MMKLHVIIGLVLLVLVVASCSGNRDPTPAKGTQGLTMSFLPSNPRTEISVSDQEELVSVVIDIRNRGAFPTGNDDNPLGDGHVYLSGFDSTILYFDQQAEHLEASFLDGATSINPEGGIDTVEFEGSIFPGSIIADTYAPTILATLCYPYATRSTENVCIDPFPFDNSQRKVCQIGSHSLSGQGAPVAITRVDQEASSNRIQFRIQIENRGSGDIIRLDSLDKCDPLSGERLEREDMNHVELIQATVGSHSLFCEPLVDNGLIRLVDGKGFILCSLDKSAYEFEKSAYLTPLNLELRYGYRTTIAKSININKVSTVR